MKLHTKGSALMGLIVIIVAILAVGGVVYYANKNPQPLSQQNIAPIDQNQTACTLSSAPSITIISPNGGEKFYKNSAINLIWKSCNVESSVHLSAELVDVNYPSGGAALLCEGGTDTWDDSCLNDGEQTFGIAPWQPGTYKAKIFSREGVEVSDLSDATFTIDANNAPDNTPRESGDDINGQHIAEITNISGEANASITLDYVQWVNCSASADSGECMNGSEIVNINPKLRTFPVSPDVVVKLQTYSHQTEGIDKGNFNYNQVVPFSTLVEVVNAQSQSSHHYWITLKGGVVIEIIEQYQP